MVALRVESLGKFMSGLFSGNSFDSFLLVEGTLRTAVTWHLEGRLNREFFGEEQEETDREEGEQIPWSEIRPLLRELVRGRRTPLSFRFVLALKPRYMEALLSREQDRELSECVAAFVLTILFGGDGAQIRTGISMKSFTMNKNADILWDRTVQKFLQSKDIQFETLS